MLGMIIAVVAVVAVFVGLEAGSPGVLKAIIHASVSLYHADHTHLGQQICTQLLDLNDKSDVCASQY